MRRLVPLFCVCLSSIAVVEGVALAQGYDSNVHQRYIGGKTQQSERDEQAALFDYYFENREFTYETKLASLKKSGAVPAWRTPYSAEIHPQSGGGLSEGAGRRRRAGGFASGHSPLSLYDAAFNGGGGNSANSWELRRVMGGSERALFAGARMRRANESWEGYCSGFTAASIKHPEPVRAVDAGQVGGAPGVVFQPSDIKALLTCVYNRTTDDSFLYLAPPSARDGGPNMGTFHLAITNYIGQAGCPVGIDTTKGTESWNYPIYSYHVDSIEDAGAGSGGVSFKDVQMTVTMAYYGSDGAIQTNRSTGDKEPSQKQTKTYRYVLALDKDGTIVGGRAENDSGEFLWLPLYAPQAKADATVQGNPYIDVRKVIAMARLSAMPAMQKKYDEATLGPEIDPALTKPAARSAAKADAKGPQKQEAPKADAAKEGSSEESP